MFDGLSNIGMKNQLVGEMLYQHNEFSFASQKMKKDTYFMVQSRAEIKDIPIVISINKSILKLKKVSADRDRNTFDDRLTSSCVIVFEGFHTTPASHPVIDYILNSSKKLWEKGKGHPLLQAMADNFYLCNL